MSRIFAIIFILLSISVADAQLKFGNHLLGPTLGFSSKGSAVIWGGNYEYELPQAGIGLFSIGAIGRFWTYNDNYDNLSIDVTSIALGGQVNYNFNTIGTGKFVPFVGLFIGYQNVSSKYTAYDPNTVIAINQNYKSAFQVWGQAGFRFFFTPHIAGVLRLGLGNLDFSTVEVGADFKL